MTTPYACTTYYRLKPHVKILTDTAKIFFRYLKNPRQMGTVCPSSRFLAKKMVSGINRKCGVIVELGPGTGAITKHLVDSGLAKDCKLYCIEFDSSLIPHLERKFPSAKIVNGSAEDLRDIVGADTARICAVVSSLPLISLPKEVVHKILSEVEAALPAGGRFIQFTYNLKRSPVRMGFEKMRHIDASKVFMNIPPARVDVFEKIS